MPHPSPSLLGLGIVFAALAAGSVAAVALITGGERVPSPFLPASSTVTFFVSHRIAVRAGAFFEFGAAIVLGVFAATATSRLTFMGVRAAGVQIAFFGGVAASLSIALAAVCDWVLGQEGVGSGIDLLHAFHLWSFAMGGVAQAAGLGLLVAGVSVAGGMAGYLPKWVMAVGVVLATMAELSTLSLFTSRAFAFVTVARIGAYAWMIAVGAMLPKVRIRRGAPNVPFRSAHLEAVRDS